jgi:hypothetical protein
MIHLLEKKLTGYNPNDGSLLHYVELNTLIREIISKNNKTVAQEDVVHVAKGIAGSFGRTYKILDSEIETIEESEEPVKKTRKKKTEDNSEN